MKRDILRLLNLSISIMVSVVIILLIFEFIGSTDYIGVRYHTPLEMILLFIYSVFIYDVVFMSLMIVLYFNYKFGETTTILRQMLEERNQANAKIRADLQSINQAT